jgi:prepilin-type N-terminal cleavage/methylation domain-containing protein
LRTAQGGFTLVELLLVILILGILASVVVVSVVGLIGRGEKESYATDEKTIQTAISAFYADVHAYDIVNGWNEAGNHTTFHTYPTASGQYSSLYLGNEIDLNGYRVNIVMDGRDMTPATTSDILEAAIWMGLLTEGPGEGDITGLGPDTAPGDANSPRAGEQGPYLNPLPKSCSPNNSSNGSGTITWVIGEGGRVYGVFDSEGEWYAGFGGRYP